MADFKVRGIFHPGVLVSDIDECKRLFIDTLGLKLRWEALNVTGPSKGMTGSDTQVMSVMFLYGDEGMELEIHSYIDPPGQPMDLQHHYQIGSFHFCVKVVGLEACVEAIEKLGYKTMTDINHGKYSNYVYFRGPDGMMIELTEGDMPDNPQK